MSRRTTALSFVALLAGLVVVAVYTGEGESGESSTLRVRSTSGPATVLVDGARHGRTPAEMRLAPGRHQIVLVAPAGDVAKRGYVNRRESVKLAAGATREIRVDLERKDGLDTSGTSNPAGSGSWSRVRSREW